jgi:hypothetical protein
MIVALDYTIKRNPDPVSGMQRDVECTDGDTDGKLCLRAPRRATKKALVRGDYRGGQCAVRVGAETHEKK